MKKTLSLVVLAMSCLTTVVQAKDVSYKLDGIHNGTDYTLTVSYDTNSNNITNAPWAGWGEVLTIPSATISVKYGEKNYSSTGAVISTSTGWNKILKVESLQNPNEVINQIRFQIDAEASNTIMSPLKAVLATDTQFMGGQFSLYLNSISLFTGYNENINPLNSQFSKVSGGVDTGGDNATVCAAVKEAANELSMLCPDDYSCPWHVKDQLTNAINKLTTTCP